MTQTLFWTIKSDSFVKILFSLLFGQQFKLYTCSTLYGKRANKSSQLGDLPHFIMIHATFFTLKSSHAEFLNISSLKKEIVTRMIFEIIDCAIIAPARKSNKKIKGNNK